MTIMNNEDKDELYDRYINLELENFNMLIGDLANHYIISEYYRNIDQTFSRNPIGCFLPIGMILVQDEGSRQCISYRK